MSSQVSRTVMVDVFIPLDGKSITVKKIGELDYTHYKQGHAKIY
jgi:hypothetical protein